MAFYLDLTSLLATFAVDVTVYPPEPKEPGKWVDGAWQEPVQAEPVHLKEPVVPNSRVGLYSLNALIRETGVEIRYELVWISKGDYPIDTVVEHRGKRYLVRYVKDLKNYSNVSIYYLEAEENQQNGEL
ncbi:hypothetical protein [Loigolactobacillus bifermentans]|uniref:Phage head-tail adaptor n=1 Tax=Loigolactobacillus bifermentans DSM 20003 TaxID=1423726 RepID=A0A0R1H2S1_9LACO|nr:hypothetical protein [Loigolactobacillus bifermentans]KRK40800.1 hypothetical protein FC07_GL002549 [Loigolactobacillus bifermentans DSM 20003]QGG59552.1 hypothetical protein LB003_03130 [Loigolactobacillus bifermentans]